MTKLSAVIGSLINLATTYSEVYIASYNVIDFALLENVVQSIRLQITIPHLIMLCCINLHCKKFGYITGIIQSGFLELQFPISN